jgi:two-component system cell cycle sensor histidine kinase/response regulator CckA
VVADVRQAITTVRDLCEAVLPRNVAIRLDALDTAWVPLAQEQLEQVLLNLVLNARDAMPRGGTITMAATRTGAPVDAGAGEHGPADAVSGAHVQIEVRDTGTGMRPDVLPRIFEPFFTTKGESGTGLGLMIAKELIEQAGGRIRVESQYEQGATFRIELPQHVLPQVRSGPTAE